MQPTGFAEFGKDKFYVDAGCLFCKHCKVVVDHVRENIVDRHLISKVLSIIVLKFFRLVSLAILI